MENAIGLIESKGLVALIEAADVILKNSPVKMLGIHKLENGLISLAVQGDSDYVKAAVESGVDAGKRVGEIYSFSIIDNPAKELLTFFKELFPGVTLYQEQDFTDNIITPSKIQIEKENQVENRVEVPFVKPALKSESKREKSKPLVVTKIHPIEKIKKLNKKKSKDSNQKPVEPDTTKEDETKPGANPEINNGITVSTIERLRLEALGLNNKSKEQGSSGFDNEESSTEGNKINLALDKKDIDFNIIEKMNVHKLRNYARKFPDFPIKGREISRANRDELVKLFKNLSKQ